MTTARRLTRLARGAARVQRDQLALWPGLRAAVGMAAPLALGLATGHPRAGAMATLGALPVGFASIVGTYRAPLLAMIATSLGVALSTFVGSVSSRVLPLSLVVLAVWGAFGGLLVALGQTASVVGLLTVLGLLLGLGGEPQSPGQALQSAGLVLAGALLQTVLAAVVRTTEPYSPQRAAVADVYRALAEHARNPSADPAALGVTAAIDTARPLVTPPPAPAGREMQDALQGLVDEADRTRLELVALAAAREQSGEEEPGGLLRPLEEIDRQVAGALDAIASGLAEGRAPEGAEPDLEPEAAQLAARIEATAGRLPLDASGRLLQVPDRVSALAGQLRAARRLAGTASGAPEGGRLAAMPSLVPRGRVVDAVRTLRSNLTLHSSAGRHAVRLATLLPATELLGHVLPVTRGYWVPLTVLFVLRPDFTTTFTRGLSRLAGTAVGLVLASVLAAALPRGSLVTVAVVAVGAWGMYAFFLANYALFSTFVTAQVVLLLDVLEPRPLDETLAARGLHTLLGGGIALLAYLLWPTWERQRLPEGLAAALESTRRYAVTVLGGYVQPRPDAEEAVLDAGAAARAARSDAEASLDKAAAEPTGGGLALDTARGVLAGLDRLLPALEALAAHRRGGEQHEPLPQLAPLAADLDTALARLVSAARSARAPRRLPRLRRRLEALARAGAGDRQPDAAGSTDLAVVIAQADVLVDAIGTVSHVLRTDPSAGGSARRQGQGAGDGAGVGVGVPMRPAASGAKSPSTEKYRSPVS